MSAATYYGLRLDGPGRGEVRVWRELPGIDEGIVIMEDVPHIVLHSPTGYEWGYAGSGPADLALSILAMYLGEEQSEEDLSYGRTLAWKLHFAFKNEVVAYLDTKGWSIPGQLIQDWLALPAHREIVDFHELERGRI